MSQATLFDDEGDFAEITIEVPLWKVYEVFHGAEIRERTVDPDLPVPHPSPTPRS